MIQGILRKLYRFEKCLLVVEKCLLVVEFWTDCLKVVESWIDCLLVVESWIDCLLVVDSCLMEKGLVVVDCLKVDCWMKDLLVFLVLKSSSTH